MAREHCVRHCTGPPNCVCEIERNLKLFLIALGTGALQLLFSWWANSVAVLSDAMHSSVHGAGYLLMVFTEIAVSRRHTQSEEVVRSRYGIWSFVIIVIAACFIFYEAWDRLITPESINLRHMLVGGFLGLAGNGWQLWICRGIEVRNQTRLYRWLELWSDFIGSLLIVFVGVPIIYLYHWPNIDALISFAIGLWMLSIGIYILFTQTIKGLSRHSH